MKKLSIVGFVLIIAGGIFFVLSAVYYQIYQDDIQKMKTIPVKAGSTPFISHVPDILIPERDIIHGSILVLVGFVIVVISKNM